MFKHFGGLTPGFFYSKNAEIAKIGIRHWGRGKRSPSGCENFDKVTGIRTMPVKF